MKPNEVMKVLNCGLQINAANVAAIAVLLIRLELLQKTLMLDCCLGLFFKTLGMILLISYFLEVF